MKTIRCEFKGCFYVDVTDEATSDQIENILSNYISYIEKTDSDYFSINEYEWNELND